VVVWHLEPDGVLEDLSAGLTLSLEGLKSTGLTEDQIIAYAARLQRTGFIMVKPSHHDCR
jgi:hypothetical protein